MFSAWFTYALVISWWQQVLFDRPLKIATLAFRKESPSFGHFFLVGRGRLLSRIYWSFIRGLSTLNPKIIIVIIILLLNLLFRLTFNFWDIKQFLFDMWLPRVIHGCSIRTTISTSMRTGTLILSQSLHIALRIISRLPIIFRADYLLLNSFDEDCI